jgi:small subunit ribosomal protein S17
MTATENTRNARRAMEGTVTSNLMEKTITVEVERTFKHAKYGKFVRKAKKYHAHDENREAKKGDRVEIIACRPYSKTKRWRLVRIIEKSKLVDAIDFSIEGGTP